MKTSHGDDYDVPDLTPEQLDALRAFEEVESPHGIRTEETCEEVRGT